MLNTWLTHIKRAHMFDTYQEDVFNYVLFICQTCVWWSMCVLNTCRYMFKYNHTHAVHVFLKQQTFTNAILCLQRIHSYITLLITTLHLAVQHNTQNRSVHNKSTGVSSLGFLRLWECLFYAQYFYLLPTSFEKVSLYMDFFLNQVSWSLN